jgi:hypothetical protein
MKRGAKKLQGEFTLDIREKCTIPEQSCCELNIGSISSYYGTSVLPDKVATTMAYVPFQTDTTMYKPETALKYGTVFPDLNKPFLGGKCI